MSDTTAEITITPELLTYEQASEMLNLSKSTLYSMVSRRRLPSGVYVGHGRFSRQKILYHIDRNSIFRK